jgi:DNA-binding FadR family transcriptional regulator
MTTERAASELSEFLQYLARENGDRLPSLVRLSEALRVNIGSLREQLEVARALGLVEVRPRTGIRKLPYSFTAAVVKSLSYAVALDPGRFFDAFSDLRSHIEMAYWFQGVKSLDDSDKILLNELVVRAFQKLDGAPIEIPHGEHRDLHLCIYHRLNNPFVTGILEAYWEIYESVGLNLYTDLAYLKTVWMYHRRMVDAICAGDTQAGYQALVEHTDLLTQRVPPVHRHRFE